jgi:hypothetical protein
MARVSPSSGYRKYFCTIGSGVKKLGSNWELEIKGADEPNRATVLLDSEFKLVKVTKNTDGWH